MCSALGLDNLKHTIQTSLCSTLFLAIVEREEDEATYVAQETGRGF